MTAGEGIAASFDGRGRLLTIRDPGIDDRDVVGDTSHWHTVEDGNNDTVYEPEGVRCQPR